MKPYVIFLLILLSACREASERPMTAQEIVDKAIDVSGGSLYGTSNFRFDFRDKTYILEKENDKKVLKRISKSDSTVITDVKRMNSFERMVNDSTINVIDSLAHKYANSINSVHYFAYLPYGLNDAAVNKELLGESQIEGQNYFKVKITFDQENGGDDFDDVYIYWFNKKTFKPDFLAYEFHVDGGGMRLREAYNERFINGIRFVDYKNYKPKEEISIFEIERLYEADKLELLSKIELLNISVTSIK